MDFIKIKILCWVPVAHTYNPHYSGGRDQEDHGSKPTQENSSMRAYLENILHKKSGSRGRAPA
jgi:hypothetical protein